MADRKKPSLTKRVISIFTAVPVLFRLLEHFLASVKYDTRVAKRSVITLLLLFLIIGLLLASVWLCLLGILLVYFISLKMSWLVALSIILILNILLLVIAGLCLLFVKNKMSFPETRQLLFNLYHNVFTTKHSNSP